ncbi:MAG: hypothetical protein K9N49_01900 [Candidatus Marinimicrobia bacterium]|nr:hypothetical protein [Candidatus Neomarinimicrobiota bacterium]
MNLRRLIWRRLWHYRRTNAGVLLGAALAATVLTGALMVGDSVRHSLTRLTLSRLGKTDFVVSAPERLFASDLAARLSAGAGEQIVPVLLLDGVVFSPEGERRVNAVQVVGVEDAFWALAPAPLASPHLPGSACRVNPALAARLGLTGQGEGLVLRLRKPGGLPADMTLATRDQDAWSRRLRVQGIQAPEAFGHFTLKTTQTPPPTIFLPLAWLSEQLGIAGRANVLLIQAPAGSATVQSLQARLDDVWRLADAGLRITRLEDGAVELLSDQVFIPPAIAEAAFGAWPDVRPVTTYFLNQITAGDRATPYSFASAAGPPRVPLTMPDDEVLINDWLAEDLDARPGSPLTVTYYAVDTGGRLVEQSADFRVGDIVSTAAVAAQDRRLTPAIPGLSDADNCRDWDPGIPIDLDRLRDQDEAYWDAYGPLPKLYLTHATAERLWRNRFGVHTALRFHGAEATLDAVGKALHASLSARDLGFTVRAARADGLAASREAVDFGQLFIGLSFFLIVAAVLLTILLFAFSIEQRAEETGTLRALGIPPAVIRRGLLAEGLMLVVAGAAVGSVLAVGYNALILLALETLWQDAVRVAVFQVQVRPVSMLAGSAGVILAALAGMAWVIRGQARLTVRELQHQQPDATDRRPGRGALVAGGILLLTAIVICSTVSAGQGREAAGAFFASGSLLLAGLILLAQGALGRWRPADAAGGAPTRGGLVWGAAVLRRGRGVACMALMALGVFLVMAVAANRRGTVRDPGARSSGTGGWRLWGQTTLPIVHDLNSERGRARYGLSDPVVDEAVFTTIRLREGDDASCLNLNRVAAPHLLGVDPAAWDQRGAFTFSRLGAGVDPAHPWRALAQAPAPDIVPAFADMADIVWGLGRTLGDTLAYTDEQGRPFQVKLMGGLAPSILQGHLIVSEAFLMQRYPSLGGARVLLVDVPAAHSAALERVLTRRLADLGLASVPATQRLAEFNAVENTYLSIFMLLGGLGVLLGSAGLGIVAARNILERRAELALLRAVGFRRGQLLRMLFLEHAALALAGMVTGVLAAGVAVAPALLAPETTIPWRGLLLTLAGVLVGSLSWIGLAVLAAMRGPLLPALRQE